MDALDRVEPVARPLLAAVDDALVSLGAPPEHPIWGLLRRVGATPADAVAGVAGLAPAALREAAGRLRDHAVPYPEAAPPENVRWHGSASTRYEAMVVALRDHLTEMVVRIGSTATYLDEVADWQEATRGRVAEALAQVLISTEAVALAWSGATQGARVLAAADVGAHVLAAGARVLAAADVGAHVLAAVATGLDQAEALGWHSDPLPDRAEPRPVDPLPGRNAIEVR